jgi:hypothetical protein
MYDYVVTADDVDTLLAVDCTPMDDNTRQGELVTEYANNGSKITCDPEMQNTIDMHISNGRAHFNLLVLGYSSDEWELAILTLKRTGYHIKVKDEVLTEEKYSSNLQVCSLVYLLIFFVLIYKCSSILAILIHVICFCLILLCFMFWQTKIPNGRTTQFVLVSSGGVNIPFNTQGISEPNNEDSDVRLRDLIVLVLRTFQSKALDAKRKGKV